MKKAILRAAACLVPLALAACATTTDAVSTTESLVLRFAPENQSLDDMGGGDVWLGLTGSIRNTGDVRVDLPDLLVVLEDENGQRVFQSIVEPPLESIAPGHIVMVNKTILHVPPQARRIEIGWAPLE